MNTLKYFSFSYGPKESCYSIFDIKRKFSYKRAGESGRESNNKTLLERERERTSGNLCNLLLLFFFIYD